MITRPAVDCIRPNCYLLHVLCYLSNVIAIKALTIRFCLHLEVSHYLPDTPVVSVIIILTAAIRLLYCP